MKVNNKVVIFNINGIKETIKETLIWRYLEPEKSMLKRIEKICKLTFENYISYDIIKIVE